MKKPTILFLLTLFILISIKTMAQSNFSSNLIGVGVVTDDLEKSLDFYLNVIGMTKTGQFDVNEDFGKISGLSNGVPFHVDVLQLGDGSDGNVWKLMSFGKKATHAKSNYIQDDLGMQYITIHVTSLQPLMKQIRKHNIKMLGDTPVPMGNGESHFILLQAPEGTFIELIGPLE